MGDRSELTLIEAMMASEVLKSDALKTRVTLDRETLKALEDVLPSLMEDVSRYRRAASAMEMRRSNMLGVKKDRSGGAEEGRAVDYFKSNDDEDPVMPKRTISYTMGFDNTLNSYIRMADTCIDSIRKALDTDTMTLYDVERIPRYLATLGQDIVREGLSEKEPLHKYQERRRNSVRELREILDTVRNKKFLHNIHTYIPDDVDASRPVMDGNVSPILKLSLADRLVLLIGDEEAVKKLDVPKGMEDVKVRYTGNGMVNEYCRLYSTHSPKVLDIIESDIDLMLQACRKSLENSAEDTPARSSVLDRLDKRYEAMVQPRREYEEEGPGGFFEKERKPYVAASDVMDRKYGQGDAYVTSRRLVDKYTEAGTLDEMDGKLKENGVTGKTVDLNIFNNVSFTYDKATGTRCLTTEGMLAYMDKLQNTRWRMEKTETAGNGDEKVGSLRIRLDEDDALLLARAFAGITVPDDPKDLGIPSAATSLAEGVARVTGSRAPADESPAEKADRLLDNMKKVCDMGYRIDSRGRLIPMYNGLAAIADELRVENNVVEGLKNGSRSRKLPPLLRQLIQYFGTRSVWMACKVGMMQGAATISYGAERRFPYVDDNGNTVDPFNGSRVEENVRLVTAVDLANVRLAALQKTLEYLPQESGSRRDIEQKLAEQRDRYTKMAEALRIELEPFMKLSADEASKRIWDAIENAHQTMDANGWFRPDPNSKAVPTNIRILEKGVKMAFRAIYDEDADVQVEAMKLLKEEEGEKRIPNTGNRMVKEGENGELSITPPPLQEMTPVARFALLTGHYITSEEDESVPEGRYGYYEDKNRSINAYLLCGNLTAAYGGKGDKEKKNGNSQKNEEKKIAIPPRTMLYEIRRFASLCDRARELLGKNGISPATQILEQAEQDAKNVFVTSWRDDFIRLKDTWALCYRDQNESGMTLMDTLRDQGSEYGDEVLRRLASRTLVTAGLEADAASAEKDDVERMTPAARYVCSRYAEVICRDTIDKIAVDMRYDEAKNSLCTDWNNWNELKKDNTEYFIYDKSTIPYMNVQSMRKGLMEAFGDDKQLMDAAVLYGNPEYRDRAVQTVKSMIEKKDEVLRVRATVMGNAFDPDINRREVKRLRRALLTMDVDPDAIYVAKEALVQIEANDPYDQELCAEIRKILEDPDFHASSEECGKCIEIVDDSGMLYMSPYSRVNADLSSTHLMEKDRAWSAGIHAEYAAMEAELDSRAEISSETLARIWMGIATEMSPEVSGVKSLLAAEAFDPDVINENSGILPAFRTSMDELKNGIGRSIDVMLHKEFHDRGESYLQGMDPKTTDMESGRETMIPAARFAEKAPVIQDSYTGEKRLETVVYNSFYGSLNEGTRISGKRQSLSMRDDNFNKLMNPGGSTNRKSTLSEWNPFWTKMFPSLTWNEDVVSVDEKYRYLFRNKTSNGKKTYLPEVSESFFKHRQSNPLSIEKDIKAGYIDKIRDKFRTIMNDSRQRAD